MKKALCRLPSFQVPSLRGKKEEALKLSDDILAQSRLLDQRDFETEAWIRMERALLGEMENNELGQELRWCVDRLASVAPGSLFTEYRY